MQDPVDLSVSRRGGGARGPLEEASIGASPSQEGEVVAVREPGQVTDLDQQPKAAPEGLTCSPSSGGPRGGDEFLVLFVGGLFRA